MFRDDYGAVSRLLLELIRAGRVQVDDSGTLQLDRTHRRRKDKAQ